MEKFCQNPLCKSKAVKEVPVSVEAPADQVRALCAACEEAYVWGVQHGKSQSRGFTIEPPPKDKGCKPLFRIVYAIDINAGNPHEAAEYGYQIMTDPESMPPVLYVIDSEGCNVRVDLSEGMNGHKKESDGGGCCAAAQYLADRGREIFTGRMNGGLWNARCMDACIISKKQDDKVAYQLLLEFGEELSRVLPVAIQKKWKCIKNKAAAILNKGDSGRDKESERV